VLELACGVGHSAFLIAATFPHLEVVATDHDFTNLWIAKRFFAPNASLICLDAEAPLPFSAGGFSAVFCLDGFHYVRSKIALGREISRVATSDALFLFPHLHNALQRNIHAGIPLTAAGYQRCFDGIPSVVYDEETVLRGFVNAGELSLDQGEPAQRIEQASSFALVATHREGFWRKRRDLAAPLYADATKLIPNPLYTLTVGRGFVDLQANWPNTTLEAECGAVKEYLPEALRLESTLLERLQGSGGGSVHDADLRSLVQRFALVRLPAVAYAGQWKAALDSLGRTR
jgi:SAM-dependent methyltransferase